MTISTTQDPLSDPVSQRVLGESIARIADFWQLSNARLGAILGLTALSASQLRRCGYALEPGGKPFELAQHLLRLFLSLDSWLGQDDEAARSWLATPNIDLGAAPLDLITTVRGLLRSGDYVDALRAQT